MQNDKDATKRDPFAAFKNAEEGGTGTPQISFMPEFSSFDAATFRQTLRDPMAWLGLCINLLPIAFVLHFGWGAGPIVLLYWLENIILGGITLLRILAIGVVSGHGGNMILSLIIGAFFTFHYGLFCYVHGIFLNVFAAIGTEGREPDFLGPVDLVASALTIAPGVMVMAGIVLGYQLILTVWDLAVRGEARESNQLEEMARPYAQIVILHVGLFAGAFALFALGQPMVGVLALILLRAAWGIANAAARSVPRQGGVGQNA